MNKVTFRHNKAASAIIGVRNSYRLFILPLLLALCTLFYYWGELVDWATWEALRHEFFYGIHDIHRLLFLIPITYAGYTARIKGAIIVTMVTFIVFLPRALFISPFPDPILRMVIFTTFAGTIGCLTGMVHNELERCRKLETQIEKERDKLLSIVDGMTDGVLIAGPDYRIRYMNSNMVEEFGEGIGQTCYEHLQKVKEPCGQDCKLIDVINNKEIRKWECKFTDGRAYEILAAPYDDTDGTVCQISIFRDITQRHNA